MSTRPQTPAIMIQGTCSDAGKSLVVAGLCRLFANRGLAVRPFKPQNMSNNAAATPDGGEIGRAQALQARACRIAPSVHMNPVLMKPQTDAGAQIVVQGRVRGSDTARGYFQRRADLLPDVLDSFARLGAEAELIVAEGAGSASEINLRAGDIANMGFARAADVPVILLGDIERGGVIASIVGTRAVIDPEDAAMVKGFIVNKFRGDPALFDAGLAEIERRSSWPSLGVLPWFAGAEALPAEDAMQIESRGDWGGADIKIAVPRFPRIANFDDADPLAGEPDVAVRFIPAGQPIPQDADLILLPGSKTTIADLAFLRAQGWDHDIQAHLRHGKPVFGLCGGFQMLGHAIADPGGLEGAPGSVAGLGLLEMDTVLQPHKLVGPVAGRCADTGCAITGYEIHAGRSSGPALAMPLLHLDDGRPDGARAANGLVAGSYVHGLFGSNAYRAAFLSQLRQGRTGGYDHDARVEAVLDDLAAHLERHLDMDAILRIARQRCGELTGM